MLAAHRFVQSWGGGVMSCRCLHGVRRHHERVWTWLCNKNGQQRIHDVGTVRDSCNGAEDCNKWELTTRARAQCHHGLVPSHQQVSEAPSGELLAMYWTREGPQGKVPSEKHPVALDAPSETAPRRETRHHQGQEARQWRVCHLVSIGLGLIAFAEKAPRESATRWAEME
jgi:hypothetical protein